MSKHDLRSKSFGVPAYTPQDLPMPPYRFHRETGGGFDSDRNGTAKQATDILRHANLLGCSASSKRD